MLWQETVGQFSAKSAFLGFPLRLSLIFKAFTLSFHHCEFSPQRAEDHVPRGESSEGTKDLGAIDLSEKTFFKIGLFQFAGEFNGYVVTP